MIVRDFREEDIVEVEALLRVHNEASLKLPSNIYSREYLCETLLQLVRSARGFVVVAVEEDEVVGVLVANATANLFVPRLQATALWWKVKYPGRGVGGSLMTAFTTWASDIGAGILAASSFTPAVDAYFERHGFTKAERNFFLVV